MLLRKKNAFKQVSGMRKLYDSFIIRSIKFRRFWWEGIPVCVEMQTHIIWSCLSDLHQLLAVQTTLFLHLKAIQFGKALGDLYSQGLLAFPDGEWHCTHLAQAPGVQPRSEGSRRCSTVSYQRGTGWSSSSTTGEDTAASALGAQDKEGSHQGQEQLWQAAWGMKSWRFWGLKPAWGAASRLQHPTGCFVIANRGMASNHASKCLTFNV